MLPTDVSDHEFYVRGFDLEQSSVADGEEEC